MNLHIVTGGSKGLGASLVKRMLDRGDHVAVISRTSGPSSSALRYYVHDLSSNLTMESLVNQIALDFSDSSYDMISLINNAAVVEPVVQVSKLIEAEILSNVMVNFYAPMALSALCLKHSFFLKKLKVIVNVTSGAARNPKASWSVYSASKAGLEAFSLALRQEVESSQNLRICTFNPGIMDTPMQEAIRHVDSEAFPDVDRFIAYKENGDLRDPDTIAKMLVEIIFNNKKSLNDHFTTKDF